MFSDDFLTGSEQKGDYCLAVIKTSNRYSKVQKKVSRNLSLSFL